LRSFAEHRAAGRPAARIATVERAPILGLLFLFNNLHAVHHRWPSLAWYRIPARYRAYRGQLAAEGEVYAGYFAVARRYLLTQHHEPSFPAAKNETVAMSIEHVFDVQHS
jgi:fatty acid desaturase